MGLGGEVLSGLEALSSVPNTTKKDKIKITPIIYDSSCPADLSGAGVGRLESKLLSTPDNSLSLNRDFVFNPFTVFEQHSL